MLMEHSYRFSEETGSKTEIDVVWFTNPFLVDPKSETFNFLSSWAKNNNMGLSFFSGASDLNKIFDYIKKKTSKRIPCVNLGPGIWQAAHRDDEYVLVGDLERFYYLYRNLIEELFEGKGRFLLG